MIVGDFALGPAARLRWAVHILILAVTFPLAGCATVAGYPQPSVDYRAEQAEIAPYVGGDALAHYEACPDKVACRNMIIDARVRAVDISFYRFERRAFGQQSGMAMGSNLVSTGLSALATVTGARVLSAGASALTGSRDQYQRQVFSVSLPLLFEEMHTSRREILVRIRQGEMMPIANYTVFQALGDISEYELAGSIPHAAGQLSSNVGTRSQSSQAQLDAIRAASFAAVTPVPTAAIVTTTAAPAVSSAPVVTTVNVPQMSPTPLVTRVVVPQVTAMRAPAPAATVVLPPPQ